MRVGNFLPFKGMKRNHGRRFKEEALNKKFNYITAKAEKSVEELWNEIIDFSIDSKAFYVSALAASIISALGLLTDSPVIVLSAMLISPLMGPILSGAFALAIKDWVLLFESILAELRAAAFTFGVGFVSCAIFGGYYESRSTIPTNEMLSRTTESGLVSGAIIALASGIIVGNAVTSSGVNSLVGVAISASLLPPIVNSGILVALSVLYCQDSEESCSGQKEFIKEALYSLSLYAENVLIIAVIAAFIFYSQRMGEVKAVYGSHSVDDTNERDVIENHRKRFGFRGDYRPRKRYYRWERSHIEWGKLISWRCHFGLFVTPDCEFGYIGSSVCLVLSRL